MSRTPAGNPLTPARPRRATPAPAAFSPPVVSTSWLLGSGIIYAFVVFELLCQLALIAPGIEAVRSVMRVAVFAGALALLVLIPPGRFPHPAIKPALCAVLILAVGLVHPQTNSFLAGIAAIAMYVAILSPLMWVSNLPIDVTLLRRVALILWAYHSASAAVGMLQMYYPELQPEPSVVFLERGDALVEGAKITLASGRQVFRPMGLSDMPGGAAGSGLYSIVFALGIWTVDRRLWMNALCLISMICAFFCIYLSQVRSILVMVAVSLSVFGLIMLVRRDHLRLVRYLFLVGSVVIASTAWAFWVGGEATVQRLLTLIEDDPASVYYYGRGYHLHYTWEVLLPEHPLGAGLGRWGMINYYFARRAAFQEPLWAEIQWTAWLFDGGAPLILAYGSAVLLAVWVSWRLSIRPDVGDLSLWASVLCAFNVASLAVTFNYPIFMSQAGLEFWLLNACLWAAWVRVRPNTAARGWAS